jgi:adenylate kinase
MACNVLIFGPPGSGKGTQAAIIGDRRGLAHISTGDMLRAAMVAGSEFGLRVKEIVERGDLVPDDLMLDLVRQRLEEADAQEGFLLDGYPRTLPQAQGLLAALDEDGRKLECVVVLEVADDMLLQRSRARGRTDDTEETIRHRLQVYKDQTEPVLAYLSNRTSVQVVDGVGGIEEISERIERALDAEHQDQE